MTTELSQDEIYDNDIDPVDALAAIRREEGNEEAAELLSRESASVDEEEETAEVVVDEEAEPAPAEEPAEGEGEVLSEIHKGSAFWRSLASQRLGKPVS